MAVPALSCVTFFEHGDRRPPAPQGAHGLSGGRWRASPLRGILDLPWERDPAPWCRGLNPDTKPAVGKKSPTDGDVRSSGQGLETFLTWGEGYALLGSAAHVCARIWPHTRVPKRPGHFPVFPLGFRAILRTVFAHGKAAVNAWACTAACGHGAFPFVMDPPDTGQNGILPFWGRGV